MGKEQNYHDFFSKADLSSYAGNYVAILDNEVVSSGKNLVEVYNGAKRKHPNKNPLLAFVPRGSLILGLFNGLGANRLESRVLVVGT